MPAISLVEIRYLTERGRLPNELLDMVRELLDDSDSGVAIAPLDLGVVDAVGQINRVTVPEIPDRVIAATAFYLGIPLVTKDHRIQAETAIATIW